MKQILIMDKDSSTLNDLSRLIVALKYEPVVIFNLNSMRQNLTRDDIAAIFLDVETKMIKAAEVIEYFNSRKYIESGDQIPIFLMFSNPKSKFVAEAKLLPHTAMLKKPVVLDNLFNLINTHLDLSSIKFEQFTNEYNLKQLKDYIEITDTWLEKFGALLNN